jgi:RNA polymerase sigma-70 factor (ECF subfamily)
MEIEEIEIPSLRPSPEQTALDADLQHKVHRLIDGLPEELRQPLALSTIQELTSNEIAQVLGIPEGTVRTRISRARQLLREKMAAMEGKNHATRHA